MRSQSMRQSHRRRGQSKVSGSTQTGASCYPPAQLFSLDTSSIKGLLHVYLATATMASHAHMQTRSAAPYTPISMSCAYHTAVTLILNRPHIPTTSREHLQRRCPCFLHVFAGIVSQVGVHRPTIRSYSETSRAQPGVFARQVYYNSGCVIKGF